MAITDKQEPEPIRNDNPETWEEVIQDYEKMDNWYPEGSRDEIKNEIIELMRKRNEFGRTKYGTPLQPYNGRDNLVDAVQELFDAVVYLKNEYIETKDLATQKIYEGALSLLESTYIKHLMKRRKNENI